MLKRRYVEHMRLIIVRCHCHVSCEVDPATQKKHFACQLVRFERSFWFGTKSLNLVLRSSCNLFHFILHAIKSTMFSFCRLVKGILSICIVIFEDFFFCFRKIKHAQSV